MGIITTTISSSTAAISLTGSVTSDGLISAYGFGNTTQISPDSWHEYQHKDY